MPHTQQATDNVADQAVLNRIWSGTLLEELTRLGITDVCVAPGSRSTPLILEADEHNDLTLHHHFDERGLGFLALGLAKASQKPVAIIVTSGTAVANLLPAVAEANLTGEKLVLLTSDRPQQLVACGANQAIVQQGIFSSHVTSALNLPSPSTAIGLPWLLTSIDHLMQQQYTQGGAVHINCPYPEPLYSNNDRSMYTHYTQSVQAWQLSSKPYMTTHQYLPNLSDLVEQDAKYLARKKGVIIVGSVDLEQAQQAQKLAQLLGWPCLCDPQSGLNSDWAYYDVWLQQLPAQQIIASTECIIQFGERIVSKRLNAWMKNQVMKGSSSCDYWVISPAQHRINQDHLPQRHIQHDGVMWSSAVLTHFKKQAFSSTHQGWANDLLSIVSSMASVIAKTLANTPNAINELVVAHDLTLRGQQRDIFVGNSLIVRLLDMLGVMPNSEIFSNRGASGIDGLIATAAGVRAKRNKPMMVLIGDTSLLYDLNSLALFDNKNKAPAVIVAMNNDGGAIFDLLPVPAQKKQALYQAPHGYQFEYAAKQFNLGYVSPQTCLEYQQVIEQHFATGQGTLLVEVVTPPELASSQLKALMQSIKELERA